MKRLLPFAWLLLFSGAVRCAPFGSVKLSHGHDIWNTAAGFPGGYVSSITQTADGYIWIGTSKGLVRYDGLTFVSASRGDSGSGENPPVLGLLRDANDQLWFADDYTHLFRYASGRLMGPLPDNGRHQYLTSVVGRTREGWLLFASELQGLVEYEHQSARVLLDPTLMPHSPTAVVQTADGTIWIGTRDAGVFRLRLAQGAPKVEHVGGQAKTKINCLFPIGDSTILIGTDKGLLSLGHGELEEAAPELRNQEILTLAKGLVGNVWIGTDARVFKADPREVEQESRIRVLDQLTVRGTVTALFEDRDGDLWIGGPETVERYRDSGFATYRTSAGLPCSNCGAIYVDGQDRVWFTPWDGGLFLLSQGIIRPIETDGLKDDTVYSIAGGPDDEVWVARKHGGITRLHLRGEALQATTYTSRTGLASDSVHSIYRTPDGTVWAGTLGGGLSRFRGEAWRTFTTQDGLPSNTISAITRNAAGEILVGTPNGLGVLTRDQCVAYTAQHGLPPGAVENLFVDSAGILWIGTTKGIAFLQSGTVHVPLRAPDALYGEILGIAESQGWLWITTSDHVLRVKRAALLSQSFGEGDYREFGLSEGLPSTEGVNRDRSVVADNRGRIWFSLNNGISVLEPTAFTRPALPVSMRMDGMLVDGRFVPSGGQVRIPAGRHRVTFRYAGVNVSNAEDVGYRYRLDNIDPTWSEPTTLREIDYTNIPPGQFRFHVMARNPDGVWGSQETVMAFEVEPAIWQARWFQLASLVALLLIVFGLYQLRIHRLRSQERQLRDVINAVPASIWSTLPEGAVDFVNQRWQQLTGLSENVLGWNWESVVHPDDRTEFVAHWHAAIKNGRAMEHEVRVRQADGEYRWLFVRNVPLRDKKGHIVKWYGTSFDIEDRKQAERERERLRELEADLAHINRVSMMGEFAASLAHEIKQPITAAVTNARTGLRWLRRDPPEIQEARETVARVVEDVNRAAEIISHLRSLYQKDAPAERAPVDINEVASEMLVLLRSEATRHSISMGTTLAPDLPKVQADRVQLQQVFMNLMLNAIEAMKDTGGELTIKSERTDHQQQLLISISDTGVGLPTARTDEIFSAFFTTKSQGTGMGLSISRTIVEAHGGRLWASGNTGRGTTFHFTLPTEAKAASSSAG